MRPFVSFKQISHRDLKFFEQQIRKGDGQPALALEHIMEMRLRDTQ